MSQHTPQSDAALGEPHASAKNVLHDIARARGKKFIVVESDADVAETIGEWLKIMGCEVEYFRSAEDALLHTNIQHADYFIVDCAPDGRITGDQLLNLLRLKRGQPISAVLIDSDAGGDHEWPTQRVPLNMPDLISTLISQDDKS